MAVDMRSQMPETARVVDQLRDAFGREMIDQMLKNSVAITKRHAQILQDSGPEKAAEFLQSVSNMPFFMLQKAA